MAKNLAEIDRLSASLTLPAVTEHVLPLDSGVREAVEAILVPCLAEFQLKRLPKAQEESRVRIHDKVWEDMQPMLAAIEQYSKIGI